jgi:conjugative transfer region protein TrbK
MDGKMLARLAAVVFVAIALTVAAIDRARQENATPVARSAPAVEPSIDPLRDEQRRCQQLGEAAADDSECLAVWAKTRDRFLGRDRSEAR